MIKLHQYNKYIKIIFLICLFFIVTICLLGIPLAKINSQLANHNDIKLVNYIWSWELHSLKTNPFNIFNANFYAPHRCSLAFTENMLGSFLLALPTILLTQNIILSYNLTVILSFIIAGLGMYWLVYYLTKNYWAALTAALIYAFAPFKLIHAVGHLHLTGMWLPYVFLYLHKFFEKQSWKNIWLLTLFIILVFLTGFHYFIFLPIVILVFFLIYYLNKKFKFNKANVKKIILALLVLLIIIIPISYPYFYLKNFTGLSRPLEVVEAQSSDLIDYLMPTFFLKNYYLNRATLEKYNGCGFISLLFLILLIIVYLKNKNGKEFKNNINFILYFTIGLIGFLFSFGLFFQFSPRSPTGLPSLYLLFYSFIPGFNGIRAANRFYVFTLLAMAVICGYVIYYFYQLKSNTKLKKIINILILFLMLTEFCYVPKLKFKKLPIATKNEQELYNWMAQQPKGKIFLELPADNQHNIQYVYNSRRHFRKIFNGYGGYEPLEYRDLINASFNFTPKEMLLLFKKYKINYLVYHFSFYKNPQTAINKIFGIAQKSAKIKYITHFGNNYVYEINY